MPVSLPFRRVTAEEIKEQRDEHYHRRAGLRLQRAEDAARFVDEVGFCLLFPARGIELPSLWEAVNGCERPLPRRHHDRALSLTWDWKDSLPTRGRVYYGKLLKQKPTFVSLAMFPYFYALSGNYGELEDYLGEYADGKMSEEAKRIYEVLLTQGASTTGVLRREAGLYGKMLASRFDRAIAELQASLKIIKTGISNANRWKYCYVYDVLIRRLPAEVERAKQIRGREAMRVIVEKLLETVVVATPSRIAWLFGWDSAVTQRLIDGLVENGPLMRVEWEGAEAVTLARLW
jgi:hypothetical protein